MNTVDVTVRKLNESDIEDVYKIVLQSFADPWTKNSLISSVEADGSVCYIAEVSSITVGFLIAQDISGEINLDSIAVNTEYRGKGIAKAMMSALCEYSHLNGCKLITLEVRSANESAIRLYDHFGFKRVGLRKNYYKNPSDDAILMTRFENENTIY